MVISGALQDLVARQLPGQHEKYVFDKLKATSKQIYTGVHFVAKAFSKLDADTFFEVGLEVMLDGIERWTVSK